MLVSKKTPLKVVRESMRQAKRPPVEFFLGFKTFYQDEPLEWVKNFQEKTLIIGGQDDRCFRPGCLEQLWQLVPQAKLEIIQGAGHIVPFEAPDHFNNLVEAFIEKE
jgi:pimeloyl-ACP methyl ester carboxylesterase